jgi:mono/diheme cytochrome c family protein
MLGRLKMLSRGFVLFAAVVACNALTATATYAQSKPVAQGKPVDGSVEAGRDLALNACTGCHMVARDQPYPPIYKGKGRPPDFKDIANKPDMNAAALRNYLASLPVVPKTGKMANPDLTEDEMRDVSNFIMTLRDESSASSRDETAASSR